MDPKLQEEVWRGWCLMLLDEFRRLQAELPPLARLRPPNLAVSHRLRRTLGQWDADTRRIVLAEVLFEAGTFADVLQVFKHEVAHQIVAELFHLDAAVDHGEAFARACALLGIPAGARMQLGTLESRRRHELLQRVEKLTALGQSGNRHEAELALAKARELALKHNLDALSEPGQGYSVLPLAPVRKQVASYIWRICEIVSEFYFTLYICRSCVRSDGTYRVIELYGEPENLETAEYVYYFLLRQGESEWQRYRRRYQTRGRRAKLSFLNGLYEGYRAKLEAETKRLETDEAMVWLGDPGLEAFYRERNPHVRTRSVRNRIQFDAHAAGVEAGKQLEMKRGVRADRKPRLLE